jgi:hypothetical protein
LKRALETRATFIKIFQFDWKYLKKFFCLRVLVYCFAVYQNS